MQLSIPNIYFKEGLPTNEELREQADSPRLFILDDLMSDAAESKDVCGMFTEGSHHFNYSVCCLIQNLFFKGRMQRTISLNAHYFLLLKSPRDSQQAAILAKQMFPSDTQKLLKPYTEATAKPHGYLFIDLKQSTPEKDRIVKNIFPNSSISSVQQQSVLQQSTTNMSHPPNMELYNTAPHQLESQPPTLYQSMYYPDAKRQRMDAPVYDTNMHTCLHCGLMFDTETHRDQHQEKCQKLEVKDESVWGTYYDCAIENLPDDVNDEDIVEEMMRMYRNTLLKIRALQKSIIHRSMMTEYVQLSQSISPEEAAKQVVCKNRKLFEGMMDEEESL